MSTNVATYEIKVRVKEGKQIGYRCDNTSFVFREVIKMFHKEARTPKQALEKCRKYGEPLSVRKVILHSVFNDFPKLMADMHIPTKSNAIKTDERIWEKRNVRRKNMYRDKNIEK